MSAYIESNEIIKRLMSEFPQFRMGIGEIDKQVKDHYTRVYETMYATGGFICLLYVPIPLGVAIIILTFIIHMLDLAITSIRLHLKRNELSAFNEEEVFLGAAFETKRSLSNLSNRISDIPCAQDEVSEVEVASEANYN